VRLKDNENINNFAKYWSLEYLFNSN